MAVEHGNLIKLFTVLLADLWFGCEGISSKCKPRLNIAFIILYLILSQSIAVCRCLGINMITL